VAEPNAGKRDFEGDAGEARHVDLDGGGERATPPAERSQSHVFRRLEPVVAEIAGAQHGIVTRRQLLEAGMGPKRIDNWLNRGRLHTMHRGVYALIPPAAQSPLAAPMAAVLACGDGAVLSHLSSAAVWGFVPWGPPEVGARDAHAPAAPKIHVTLTRCHRRPQDGIRVHRPNVPLDPRDVTRRGNIPVTTPARAVVEIAAELSTRDFERAFDEAMVRRLTSREAVRRAQRRAGRQAGAATLRMMIALTGGSRSDAERRLRALARRGGLPQPHVNARVGRFEVDFLWRAERVIVEVDGYDFHSSKAAFERDHRRDAMLQGLGFRVLRFTWRQLTQEPEFVLVQLVQALSGPTA
jgi:very-short-patch-repair endonuclease/predicted transcriptional regulator of viral defense system